MSFPPLFYIGSSSTLLFINSPLPLLFVFSSLTLKLFSLNHLHPKPFSSSFCIFSTPNPPPLLFMASSLPLLFKSSLVKPFSSSLPIFSTQTLYLFSPYLLHLFSLKTSPPKPESGHVIQHQLDAKTKHKSDTRKREESYISPVALSLSPSLASSSPQPKSDQAHLPVSPQA